MNTKIGTTFGLALLMAAGAIALMFAMGLFSAKPASAINASSVSVSVSPTKARSIGQYEVTTGVSSALTVGQRVFVTFNTKTTVPSSIAASAVRIKASIPVGPNTPAANISNTPSAVTVSGREVAITIPDMDPNTDSLGDNGIGAESVVVITFTQAAGIQNANEAASLTVTVHTDAESPKVTSSSYTITDFVSFTPTSAARGATVTVTGGGFAATCTTCNIRISPQSGTDPTTGTVRGTGTIDANGVFTGTFTPSSSTDSGFIWVTDKTGDFVVSSSSWSQKAGATPRTTTVSAGATVSVDLVDFGTGGTVDKDTGTTISGADAKTSGTTPEDFVIPSTGDTTTLLPFKFKVTAGTTNGTHKVVITDSNTNTANFSIDVVSRTLTVTPNPAAIGQSLTISGTGFTKGGTISTISGSGTANLKPSGTLSIDSAGSWSVTTTMDTIGSSADRTSDSYTITATDSGSLVGKSSGFKRTSRTLTLSPTTGAPGVAVNVSVTGMTVNDGENATTATFTITAVQSASNLALSGTTVFPVATDGSGSGTITLPLAAVVGTITFTATDNAKALNLDAVADPGQVATANLSVKAGILTVDPASAPTGQTVTVTGAGFPPNSTATALTFGTASAIPTGGITSDAIGGFSVQTQVPASTTGGSLNPGSLIISATIGLITGSTTAFAIPSPTITIVPNEAAPEDTITITGVAFNALTAVTQLDIGSASALPSPAPKAGRSGDIIAVLEVPLLNPGVYTVVMKNADNFTATGTFTALASKAAPAASTDATETVFADVIANGDNLVRVWRFSNADQAWSFYDPRPAFATANDLVKTGAGDIVWVNVTAEQAFQGGTLFPGWNLISLK